jgi:drug/metabolite transporter (DMT)-like permease
MTGNIKKGIIFSFLTAGISGFSIFYNKLVITQGIDPLIFNLLKNGGVALVISFLLIPINKFPDIKKLTMRDWQKLILIGIIGGSIPFILYFEGLKTVSAINANLIHKTLFIWVAAMAIPYLGEKVNVWQVIGYLLVAWSNLFIGGFSGLKGSTGELMILAATILWSLENIIAKVTLKNIDSHIMGWGRMIFGSLILVFIAFFQGKLWLIASIPGNLILPTVGSIILLSGYIITWYKALKLAPATVITSVLILATPVTNILTAVFISHNFPQVQLVNLVFTTLGIVFIAFFLPKTVNLKSKLTVKV